jgi:hypothetical protein
LPDISALNGTAIDNVAEFDGLTVTEGVPAPAAAYSVRLLGSGVGVPTYTGDCMRVRRASDNVEADIAFDAGELKLTSGVSNTSDAQSYTDFADFVDHTGTPTSAFCRYWYDQSGNANDAGQATQASQPQIYDATTGLITENGKPTVLFQPSKNLESSLTTSPTSSITGTSFRVLNKTGTGDRFMANLTQINAAYLGLARSGSGVTTIYSGFEPGITPDFYINGTSFDLDNNNAGDLWTALPTQALTTGVWTIVAQNPAIAYAFSYGGAYDDFASQEYIIFESDQSTNRTGIESDINGYFSIF